MNWDAVITVHPAGALSTILTLQDCNHHNNLFGDVWHMLELALGYLLQKLLLNMEGSEEGQSPEPSALYFAVLKHISGRS